MSFDVAMGVFTVAGGVLLVMQIAGRLPRRELLVWLCCGLLATIAILLRFRSEL